MVEQEYFHLSPANGHVPVEGVRNLSDFLKVRLSALGYLVELIQEDWGYWIDVRRQNTRMAIGVYGVDEDTPDRQYAVTVFTETARQWVIWPFWARSIEAELRTLQDDLTKLLDDLRSHFMIDRTVDYPL